MTNAERPLAVLFADVAGSTRLYEQLGDAAALAAIADCLALAERIAVGGGGRLVKIIGDEVMLVFGTAAEAVSAAGDVQGRLAMLPPRGAQRLALRMGIHCGHAIEVNGDVFGDCVNVAARMTALAKGGQVILSSAAAESLAPWQRRRLREVDVLTVKGKAEDIRIFELVWQDEAEEMTVLATRQQLRAARLELRHGTRTIALDERTNVLTLGRDPASDVVIGDRMASRQHGRIERRRDKFVLVDQSSNGTFVTIDGEREVALRREEMLLRGRGRVSFGHSYAADPTETLAFVCFDGDA